MRMKDFLRYLDVAMESSLRSDLQANYKPKGHLSLSNFKEKRITKITPEMKESPITFLKHVNVDRDTTYIWYDDKDIVGLGSVRYNDPNHNWITAIQVNPKYRGNSLGDQILDFCVKTLKGNALAVASDNKIAFEMYKKRGFSVSKESLADVEAGRRHVYFMYLK